jgi:Super-infection exclusion protein B
MEASKFLEAIKLSPKYLLPIVIVAGFLLFAKPEILDIFGLGKLSATYKPYIGGIFLLSAALVLSNWLVSLYAWYAKRRVWSKRIKHAKRTLHNLTDAEREILRGYVGGNTRTQYLQLEDGVASGLELEYIIFRSSNVGNLDDGWAFNIQPWAWKYLNERPELLFTKEELESGQWREVSNNSLSRRYW